MASSFINKLLYNSHFLYADPLAKSSLSRSTRCRMLRKCRIYEERTREFMETSEGQPNSDSSHDDNPTEPFDAVSSSSDYNSVSDGEESTSDYYDEDLDRENEVDSDIDGNDDDFQASGLELSATQDEASVIEDNPLFQGCPLTVTSSSVLIMQYKMRHNLTNVAIVDLLKLLKLHCPNPNQCVPSLYMLNKRFIELKYKIKLHYFCSSCLQEVTDSSIAICPNDSCMHNLAQNGISSFIEIPIEPQLKAILERKLI